MTKKEKEKEKRKEKSTSKVSKKETKLGYLIWFRLARVYNQNLKSTNIHLKEWDLTTAQFDVLSHIANEHPIMQQELADKLFVTKGNITQLLNKLESLGYIRREREWKTNFLYLTPEGKELFDEVLPAHLEYQADQYKQLTKDEKKQLLQLLKKIQI